MVLRDNLMIMIFFFMVSYIRGFEQHLPFSSTISKKKKKISLNIFLEYLLKVFKVS